MNPSEVVPHEVQRHGCRVIFQLFAEAIRKPREPTHGHSHGQVRPLHVGRAHVLRIGIAEHVLLRASDALSGAVPRRIGLSTDYRDFIGKLDMFHPRYGQQMLLPYQPESDTGKGI
jgi:hypothetical protein